MSFSAAALKDDLEVYNPRQTLVCSERVANRTAKLEIAEFDHRIEGAEALRVLWRKDPSGSGSVISVSIEAPGCR